MKSLYLCFASLLLTLTAVAQRNYVPGVLLLPNGDSISGQIDYRKWDVNPLTISFRENEAGAHRDYAAADLKGFRINDNNETYVSIAAVIDVTRETLDALSFTAARDTIGGRHFFRLLTAGPVQLLQYTDRFYRMHYAMTEKDSVTLLVRKTVYLTDDGSGASGHLKTYSFYRNQLMSLMSGCVSQQRLANLDYTTAALNKVLQQYAACRYPGQQVQLPKAEKDMRITYGVMGGGGLNLFNLSGKHDVALGNYSGAPAPLVGVFMDIPLSRNRQKLSWNNEVVYTSRAFKGTWTKGLYENQVNVNLNYLQVQTLLKYTFPNGNLRPYVNAGVAGAIMLGGKDEWRKTSEYFQSDEQEPAIGGAGKLSLPWLAGAGVRYGRLNAEVRVSMLRDMSEYTLLRVTNTSLQLLVRYTLF